MRNQRHALHDIPTKSALPEVPIMHQDVLAFLHTWGMGSDIFEYAFMRDTPKTMQGAAWKIITLSGHSKPTTDKRDDTQINVATGKLNKTQNGNYNLSI